MKLSISSEKSATMQFKWKIFRVFLMLSLVVFLFASTRRGYPDKTFAQCVQLKTEISMLEHGLQQKQSLNDDDSRRRKLYLSQLNSMQTRVETILDEARERRKRRAFWWIGAVAVLILGLVVTLFFSWRADVKRLKAEMKQ